MRENDNNRHFANIINKLVALVVILTLALGTCLLFLINGIPDFLKLQTTNSEKDIAAMKKVAEFNLSKGKKNPVKENLWIAPDVATIPNDEKGKQIIYGRELI